MATLCTQIITIIIVTLLITSYFLEMINAAGFNVKKNLVLGPEIRVMQGRLRPKVLTARSNGKFYGFLGIPYGTPPEQNLRFLPPSVGSPWEGVLESTEYGNKCIQYDVPSKKVIGSEDCLYLNVFTPKLPVPQNESTNSNNNKKRDDQDEEENPLYPVMVFIHPGLFMSGSGAAYDPKYFMDEKVVIVTLNYRLGSFGFLNSGDEAAMGNMGLKDQVMALEWVKENIHNFNGDRDYVTIFGENAGGASVHLHMLSPMSKGLFHRGISQSGTALCPWAFTREPKKQAKRLAAMMNCPTNDMQEMVFCLKDKNATELAEKHAQFFEWNTDPISAFGPSVEKSLNEIGVFLSDTPYMLISKNQVNEVPWIVGVNSQPGQVNAASILLNKKLTAEMNQDWYRVAPLTFSYRDTAIQRDAVSNQIRSYYFGSAEISDKTQVNLTNLYSDRLYCYCSRVGALLHKKFNEGSPVYLYQFALNLPMRSFLNTLNIHKSTGASQGDELSYLFHMDIRAHNKAVFNEIKSLTRYHDFSKKFIALWVSFAQTGIPAQTWGPALDWKQIQTDEVKGDVALKYYRIDFNTSIIDEPYAPRMTFWDNLPLNEYEDEMSVYSRSGDEDEDY